MMEHAQRISLFVVIGLVVTFISGWLGSPYIAGFLSANLVTLLVALVAINTTTLSVVLTKIREISDRVGGCNFARTAKEMRASIVEQVILIVTALVLQLIGTSTVIEQEAPLIASVCSILLVAIFANAIYILYDTARSVFVILEFENGTKLSPKVPQIAQDNAGHGNGATKPLKAAQPKRRIKKVS